MHTLLEHSGVNLTPSKIENAALIVIDAQNEYLHGSLPLVGIKPAIAEIQKLLAAARKAGSPVFHVVHNAKPGAKLFNPESELSHIISSVKPVEGEDIIIKPLPNSFCHTDLHEKLKEIGKMELLVCGFMTHLCVSSTVRAAIEYGYKTTIVSKACATRDLMTHTGEIVTAEQINQSEFAALRDRFAVVVESLV